MEKKLNSLFKKYPKIFRQKDLPMTETCMCWGIECGDGWFDIISTLCENIQKYVDETGCPQVEAVQVKEKFGGLRFYVYNSDDFVENLINQAETESYQTCERCGTKNDVITKGSWITTLCGSCRKRYHINQNVT